MERIAYTVRAILPDDATAEEYVAWLEDGHVDRVIEKGARSAMIVRLDHEPGQPPAVETRYIFATRENFDQYIRDHAPALRQEGLERFPAERGIRFERTVGRIV
jgi:hypothetical protein